MKKPFSNFAIFILFIHVFAGCKENTTKEMIINKWRFIKISGPETEMMPDSIKQKLYATATLTFKKAGVFEVSGGRVKGVKKGTYTISDDGKTLYSKDDDAMKTDTMIILQISKERMVMSPKNGAMQATMVPF